MASNHCDARKTLHQNASEVIGWKRNLVAEGIEPNPGPSWKELINALQQKLDTAEMEDFNSVLESLKSCIQSTTSSKLIDTQMVMEFIEDSRNQDLLKNIGLSNAGRRLMTEAMDSLIPKLITKEPTLNEILNTCKITGNRGKLPELNNFISRGKETEETIQYFIERNIKNFPYTEKQKYSFLYAIGGSGYGKTWIGKYVPIKIQQYYPETKVIFILLDFSNGDAFHNNIDKDHDENELDEEAARVSLGFRAAARFFFGQSASSTLSELKSHQFAVGNWFGIQFVIRQIRENLGLAPKERLYICLQFDEPQMAPKLVQKLLHSVGSFSVNISGESEAQRQNTIIFPVITGTSSKNIKQQVTYYSHQHIQLTPLSFLESCRLLNNLCPNLTPWKKLGQAWDRIVMSAGGLPRLLSVLAEQIERFENKQPNLQLLLYNWAKIIEGNYKVSEWTLRFGGMDNLLTIIEWALLRRPVSKDTAVGNCTIEDIMQEGVIFLAPGEHFVDQTQTTYYIMFPQILLWLINSKHLFITEHNVLNPIDDSWNWNVFETFENQWDSLKGNLCVKTGTNKISFGKYYSSVVSPEAYEKLEFELKQTAVVTETKQFLPRKDGTAAVPNEIETNLGPIPKEKWFDYAFRCAPGNPHIDSRIFRQATDGGKDWMICKQSKHTANRNPIGLSTIKEHFEKFISKIGNYQNQFRVVFVLVTNQHIGAADKAEIFHNADGVILVTGDDLLEYTSPSLYNYFMYEKKSNVVADELDLVDIGSQPDNDPVHELDGQPVDTGSAEPSSKRQKID